MRMFDDTGREFLSNYVGADYANALSSLPERHAVFFGRGQLCQNPLLVKLNDRDDFRAVFRAKFPVLSRASGAPLPSPAVPNADAAASSLSSRTQVDNLEDDIPF